MSSTDEKSFKDVEHGAQVVKVSQDQPAPAPAWRAKIATVERKLGIEVQGVKRVTEEDRDPRSRVWQCAEVWLSANTVLSTFSLGILGPAIFGLGLGDSLICIVVFNALAAAIPAFFSVFGVKTGLRQMVVSRYMWGWWGTKLVAILNVIACIGWSTINSIAGLQLGAQTLRVVADLDISHAVGIVILAVLTLILGVVGYRYIHYFDRFAWMPTAIVFVIILGLTAKNFVNTPMGTGSSEAAGILSFASTIWGYGVGWSSLASDYTVYQPAHTPAHKVFFWTFAGLVTPLILVMSLGTAVMCAALNQPTWMAAYNTEELGGLIGAALGHGGFAKFLMVVLVFSVIANNIVNVYSFGCSVASISTYFNIIPQFVWPICITAIYIPIAIAAATSFVHSLESFMNVLGAWLSIYIAVMVAEHFVFRKGSLCAYDLSAYQDRRRMPVGHAAVGAGCCGAVGAITGLAQAWWTGPIAGKIGTSGGDISWLLCLTFTSVAYVPLRYLEKKSVGR